MQKLVFDILPQLAENTLFYRNWDTKNKKYLEQAIFLADDQKVLRAELKKRNLTAFVADERAEFPTGQCVEQFHLLRRNL